MILDSRLQLSAAQELTASAVSTNVIDLGADRDIGVGDPLWLVIPVLVSMTGTSPTFSVSIQTDDNSGFSSATTLLASSAVAGSTIPAGTLIVVPFPFANERYVRANYTLAGTSPTITIDAYLTNQPPKTNVVYPDAI